MEFNSITHISIGGSDIPVFSNLEISQSFHDHHHFALYIRQDNGQQAAQAIKNYIGKEITVSISSKAAQGKVDFKGLVTSVSSGKEQNGSLGQIVIRGYSPTILLDDDPHIETFEQKNLQSIASSTLGQYPQNLLKSSVKPKSSETLKYIVQYKENSWQFLRRLAGFNGEFFFYDGGQLVFGDYSPKSLTLTQDLDLNSFNLETHVRSTNQNFHAYEYRQDKVAQMDTKSQQAKGNQYTDHVLQQSDSLFTRQALYKVNQQINSSADKQVQMLAQRQKKSRVAQMVLMNGQSTNPGVAIGATANIKESPLEPVDYGSYFVTEVTHFCTGEGVYHNYFTAIPAEAATPNFDINAMPFCEPQSATVVENHDPKALGRIKARFRWQQQGTTPWMRVVSASGGAGKGMYVIPEVGEEVMVDFEGGNPELPYVIGTTYNGSAKSSFGNAGNDVKALQTRSGNKLIMNDSAGSVFVEDKDGNSMMMDGAGNVTVVSNKIVTINATNEIIMNTKKFTINSENEINLYSKKLDAQFTETAAIVGKNKAEFLSDTEVSIWSQNKTEVVGTTECAVSSGTKTEVSAPTLGLYGEQEIKANGAIINLNS